MVRLLISIFFKLVANTVGLIVAALVLDDMTLNGVGFVVALLIFTVVEVIAQPLIFKIAVQHASALQGGTALVTTFVSLLVADLLSDGLSIEGGTTWVLATLIVWLAAVLAGVILPLVLFRRAMEERRAA